ncbi:MAG: hypothetical protein CMK89_11130 [Pseudomonadales bacterium]|nr:hypothetical protein [Pseudomonadales bacterium]
MKTTKTSLIKITLIAFAAMLAQGCTIYWSGMVDNKSGKNITVTGKGTDETTWKVSADESVKITWKYKCLEVTEGDKSYYFDAQNVPKAAQKMTGVTYTVYTAYRDQQMFYVMEGGNPQPLPKLESCPAK